MTNSQCENCVWMREILTTRSRFLLCRRSEEDRKFAKYPPQPVRNCPGHEANESSQEKEPE